MVYYDDTSWLVPSPCLPLPLADYEMITGLFVCFSADPIIGIRFSHIICAPLKMAHAFLKSKMCKRMSK